MYACEDVAGSGPDQVRSALEHAFCLPMMLVMNFTLLMYFEAVYRSVKRKKDCAFDSFASLVGFSYQAECVLRHMNDISEVSLMLAFLMQISIITNDARKLSSLRSLRYLMR
uniref:Uncharacterized protein n=1 Tax=Globisporangium ultimum (strain ATCC 200006 / CBS 805.95 / DAOM BR144) TaxID=431595 RepID=K3WY49_GLOUD